MRNEKLSHTIILGLELYYTHREDANKHGAQWDKAGDLDAIFDAAIRDGWSITAMAGSFWFTRGTGTEIEKVHVNEKNLPDGGETLMPDAPIGLQIIENAFAKQGKGIAVINADEHGGIKNCLKEVITTKVKGMVNDEIPRD